MHFAVVNYAMAFIFKTSLFEPRSTFYQSSEESVSDVDEDEILDDREEDKEEKKSLKAKLVAIQVRNHSFYIPPTLCIYLWAWDVFQCE